MSKTFTVKDFNREVNAVLKKATVEQKANVRCAMLYKALRYQVKGGK